MKQSIGVAIFALYLSMGITMPAQALGADQPATSPGQPGRCDLSKTEGMDKFVGSEAARKLLAQSGFVVTGQQFKQIFSAYIGGDLPKFITTDSAWHTYHVLLEEGVKQLEEGQAPRLREFSELLLAVVRKQMKSDQPQFSELAEFAAIGLALQDESFLKTLPAGQAKTVRAIKSGTRPVQPPIGFELMPQRFRAESFYAESSDLADYFAARQWYGTVVFRLKNDRETALAIKLAMLISGDAQLAKLWGQLSEPYDALLAKVEDGAVPAYAAAAAKVMGKGADMSRVDKALPAMRKALAAALSDPRVNDQLLSPTQYENFAAEIKGFRLLPPRRIPSAVCFQDTVDPAIKDRMLPSGLDFLVACKQLRSPAAERALTAQCGESTAKAVARADCGELPDSLHGEALKLIASLQKPPAGSAPAALRTETWRDKQLWTQLGAWAEQRHTWALHTKLTVHYLGMTMEPAGMVSPYPEFFSGLGKLARETAAALDKAGTGKRLDVSATAKDLLEHIELYRFAIQVMQREPDAKDRAKLEAAAGKIERLFEFLEHYAKHTRRNFQGQADADAILADLEKLLGKCAKSGKASKGDTAILKLFAHSSGEVSALLAEFAGVCDTLAEIAAKQLEDKKLSKKDQAFIKHYGISLAKFHFYGGNSWLSPRDDFPIVTPIFVSPAGNRNTILYAALARPQALYLIAPVGGKPHLFRGAVMSYREFERPIGEPLDDQAWRDLIKQSPAPPPPAFTRSFLTHMTAEDVIGLLRAGKTYADIDSVAGREITSAMIDIIDKGEHPDVPWMIKHLCHRCTDRDAGDLIALMTKTPEHGGLDDLALAVSDLQWKPHNDRLMKMLDNSSPKHADAAAYVLSQEPNQIDTARLTAGFDKRPVRGKRLYCFLLGQAGKADANVKKVLLQALADKDAGLRWQAIEAVGQIGLGDEGVNALIDRIDDDNEFVAAAAVQALVSLKATKAAPAMLARLNKPIRPRNITDNTTHRQSKAITAGTHQSGLVVLMVLRPRGRLLGDYLTSLGEALVAGLGELAHKPARGRLESMLTGNYGQEAIEALGKIDPKNQTDRLMKLALNPKADSLGREMALEKLSETRDEKLAARLVGLLSETAAFGGTYNDKPWRVCDQAANTIASLLGWPDRLDKFGDLAERTKLIEKIRKWAKEKE